MTIQKKFLNPLEEPSTHGSFVLVIAQTIEELGFNCKSVFDATSINIDNVELSKSRVAISQLAPVWRRGVDITSNDALGIEVAQRIRPITFEALSMALFASESLLSALNNFSRYHSMISDAIDMKIEVSESTVNYTIINSLPQRAVEGLDCSIASPLNFCKEISRSDISPVKACFTRSPPNNIAAFERFFNCPMEFNSDKNSVSLPKEFVEKKLPGSNIELSNHLGQLVHNYIKSRKDSETLNQIYLFILTHLSTGMMSEVSLAEHFNCSPRQLQRKLKDEGTSYRELLDKVRMDLAEQYISINNFTIPETAYLLGYSDPNNFSRAFKKWMGVSPGSFRNKLTPKGAC